MMKEKIMMKRNVIAWGVSLAFGAVAVSSLAAESSNVLENPGFEDATITDMAKAYPALLERRVEIAADRSAPMPTGWNLNENDGWKEGEGCVFKYLEGEPGKEVFQGNRAVYFASNDRATICGKQLKVADAPSPDEPTLKLHGPNRFSFYAKGSGQLSVRGYTYGNKEPNVFSEYTVAPKTFELTGEWQKYEGTIEFPYEGVLSCAFALVVKGEATVDEVELIGF
jgi:hypothetical protein